MEFSRGNEAIRTHREKGKSLYLFDKVRKGFYKYVGQMQYVGYGEEEGRDKNGKLRKVIVFRLKPID